MRHIETTRMRLWASQAFVWDLKIISSLELLLFKKTIFELFVDRSTRDTILDHPSELFMKISSIQVQYPWKFIRKTQFPIERRKKVNNEKGERGTLYHWSFKWTYKFSCGKLKFAFSRRLNFFPINSNAYAKCAQHFKMEIHGLRNVLKGKGINSPLLLLVSRCRWEIGQPENLVLSKKKSGKKKSSRIISNVQWGLQYFFSVLRFLLRYGFSASLELKFPPENFLSLFPSSGTS